jgi:predicted nuclease of predicted toxin-antitoxin system
MMLWLDAQLPPALAAWLCSECGVQCSAIREVGLRDASDEEIFFAARSARAVVMTKDSDFVSMLERHGVPPQVVWLTIGNCSNEALKNVLRDTWRTVSSLLEQGEPLVEIGPSGQ